MKDSNTNEDFVNNKFQPALQKVISQFNDRGLMTANPGKLQARIKYYDIITTIEVPIELSKDSDIIFVYSSDNTFILSNIPENKELLPFNEINVSNIIRSLYAS